MTESNQNKKIIKNYISRFVAGEVSGTEIKKIRKTLINYDREEWKKLITIFKELFDEFLDEASGKTENKIPVEWRDDIKNFARSIINLTFAVFNENTLYGSMQLEKQGNLSEQEKLTKSFLLILPELKKVAARSNNRVANYYKVEVSLSKKVKRLFSLGRYLINGSKADMETSGKEFFNIAKSLTADEILVLKKKLKGFAVEVIKKFASQNTSLFKNTSKAREAVKTFLDFIDAFADEKLIKDFVDIGAKYLEKCIENDKEPTFSIKSFKKTGLEQEIRNLLIALTNHLNKLAGEGTKNENVSSEESERILTKILTDNPSLEVPPTENDENIFNSITNSLKGDVEKVLSNTSFDEVMSNMEKNLTTVQSKGKWYKNPWFVGFSIVGSLVGIGLVVWFFVRKKDKARHSYN